MKKKVNPKFKIFKKSIAIVGDGLCEKIYFDQMKTSGKGLTWQIKPELPKQGGSWSKVFEKAKELLDTQIDEIHCLIDYDKVLEEGSLKYEQQKKQLLKTKKVFIYEQNPCFETWFLIHYERTTKVFQQCQKVEAALKKYISNYNKSQDFQKNLYDLLKTKQIVAIQNAQFLESDDIRTSEDIPRAQVYKLLELLLNDT
jgi:RloB-like protein